MGTNFLGLAAAQTIVDTVHSVEVNVGFDGSVSVSHALPGDPVAAMEAEAEALGEGGYFFTVYDDIGVDYSFSPSPIFIDLEKNPQQGGFAQGDTLLVGSLDTSAPVPGMFEIVGSLFDDVIRGSDEVPEGAIFNNPGDQVLDGGPGNDVLEGRGGADTLNGGDGLDIASYFPAQN